MALGSRLKTGHTKKNQFFWSMVFMPLYFLLRREHPAVCMLLTFVLLSVKRWSVKNTLLFLSLLFCAALRYREISRALQGPTTILCKILLME